MLLGYFDPAVETSWSGYSFGQVDKYVSGLGEGYVGDY